MKLCEGAPHARLRPCAAHGSRRPGSPWSWMRRAMPSARSPTGFWATLASVTGQGEGSRRYLQGPLEPQIILILQIMQQESRCSIKPEAAESQLWGAGAPAVSADTPSHPAGAAPPLAPACEVQCTCPASSAGGRLHVLSTWCPCLATFMKVWVQLAGTRCTPVAGDS